MKDEEGNQVPHGSEAEMVEAYEDKMEAEHGEVSTLSKTEERYAKAKVDTAPVVDALAKYGFTKDRIASFPAGNYYFFTGLDILSEDNSDMTEAEEDVLWELSTRTPEVNINANGFMVAMQPLEVNSLTEEEKALLDRYDFKPVKMDQSFIVANEPRGESEGQYPDFFIDKLDKTQVAIIDGRIGSMEQLEKDKAKMERAVLNKDTPDRDVFFNEDGVAATTYQPIIKADGGLLFTGAW